MRDGTAGRERDLALSEVVGFVLLLGVVVAAMALWMMYVVPANGREEEIDQMSDVKDRFTDYKIALDSLWINSPEGADWNQEGVTLSTSFNLGTGGGNTQVGGMFLPMLSPVASPAVLAVEDNGDTMTIQYTGSDGTLHTRIYNITVLRYKSQNYHWIQQDYYYQSGGVFLEQINGSTCRVAPPVSFVNTTDPTGTQVTHTVTVVPIRLNGIGNMGGNGPVRTDTRLKVLETPTEGEYAMVNVSVSVKDYDAARMWLDVFNTSRRNGGITDRNWYEVGISKSNVRPGFASMNITGIVDDNTADVILKLQPVEYDVTLNSIASDYS